MLVGQAAVERERGNVTEAVRLLRTARSEAFTLEPGQRPMITGLHDAWLLEWVSSQLNVLAPAARFDEAHALLDAQLADEALTGRPRTTIAAMKADLAGYQRIQAALAAGRDGRGDEARAALATVASDADVSERTRRDAQRLLERMSK